MRITVIIDTDAKPFQHARSAGDYDGVLRRAFHRVLQIINGNTEIDAGQDLVPTDPTVERDIQLSDVYTRGAVGTVRLESGEPTKGG